MLLSTKVTVMVVQLKTLSIFIHDRFDCQLYNHFLIKPHNTSPALLFYQMPLILITDPQWTHVLSS